MPLPVRFSQVAKTTYTSAILYLVHLAPLMTPTAIASFRNQPTVTGTPLDNTRSAEKHIAWINKIEPRRLRKEKQKAAKQQGIGASTLSLNKRSPSARIWCKHPDPQRHGTTRKQVQGFGGSTLTPKALSVFDSPPSIPPQPLGGRVHGYERLS